VNEKNYLQSKDDGNTHTGTVPNQQVHYKLTEVVAQPVYEALESILDRFRLQGTLSVPEQFTAALKNVSMKLCFRSAKFSAMYINGIRIWVQISGIHGPFN
jgi:hypothetical protein